MVATVGNWIYMRGENMKRDERNGTAEEVVSRGGAEAGEKYGENSEEELLDWHPQFRYIL